MSLANKDDLKTAVSEWLYRSGDAALAARADDFIALFEAEFVVDPANRTFEMEVTATAPILAAAVPLPSDFIDMIALKATGNPNGLPDQPLDYVTPRVAADMDQSAQSPVGGLAVAQKYTTLSNQIIITPQRWAPVGGNLQMSYYAFAPLTTGGTNWLLTKYPQIYLYGTLMQAAAYVDDDRTVAKWSEGLSTAMAKLAQAERKRKLGAGPLRMSPSAGFRR